MTQKKIKQEVIDELMKEYRGPEDFQALFTALKKAVMERALNAELSAHLGYEKGEEKPASELNHRNGSSGKTVLGLEIARRIGVAPSTVRETIRRFQAAGLSWPLPEDLTDTALR